MGNLPNIVRQCEQLSSSPPDSAGHLSVLQLFQSVPIEVAQNDLEQSISPDSQLFQSFPT